MRTSHYLGRYRRKFYRYHNLTGFAMCVFLLEYCLIINTLQVWHCLPTEINCFWNEKIQIWIPILIDSRPLNLLCIYSLDCYNFSAFFCRHHCTFDFECPQILLSCSDLQFIIWGTISYSLKWYFFHCCNTIKQ